MRGQVTHWCFLTDNGVKANVVMFINHIGAEAAWPALWILGLVVLLPVASPLYQTPPAEKKSYIALRKTHSEAGMLILWWSLAHGILLTVAYALRVSSFDEFVLKMVPVVVDGKWYDTEGVVNFAGWVALFFSGVLWMTDAFLRHPKFELFTLVHVMSGVGFVLFANLHDYCTLPFAWPGLILLLAARLHTTFFSDRNKEEKINHEQQQRQLQLQGQQESIQIQLITPDLLRLSLPDQILSQEIQPGQHLLLRDTHLAPLQWHPITVSSVDRIQNQLTLHIKDLGDWSQAFIHKWGKEEKETKQNSILLTHTSPIDLTDIELAGPYGRNLEPFLSLLNNSTCRRRGVIFIAGGVGITGLSEAAHVCALQGIPFTFIWIVKTLQEARALGDDILWNRRLAIALGKVRGDHQQGRENHVFARYLATAGLTSNLGSGLALFQVYVTRELKKEGGEEENKEEDCVDNLLNNDLQNANNTTFQDQQQQPQPQPQPRQQQQQSSPQRTFIKPPIQRKETRQGKSSHSSLFTIILTTSIAFMIAFILSRQLCCTRSLEIIDGNTTSYHLTCGSAQECYASNPVHQCQYCETPEEIRDNEGSEFPCCTLPRCYLCFRGLTVCMVLIVGPALAWVMLMMGGYVSKLFESEPPEEVLVEGPSFSQRDRSMVQGGEEPIGGGRNCDAVSLLYSDSNIVQVRYGPRPEMRKVLMNIVETIRYEEREEGVEEEEERKEKVGVDDAQPIVLACGPEGLLEDVQRRAREVGLQYMGL